MANSRKIRRSLPSGIALIASLGIMVWAAAPSALAQTGKATGTQAVAGQSSSPGTSVGAQPKLTITQAQKIAETTFSIPSTYTLQNQSYNDYGNQPATYSFSFQETDPSKPQTYINVSVDANSGLIVNFNQSSSNTQFVFPVPTTADQAKQIALKWAQKLYPNQYNQVQVEPLTPQSGSLTSAVTYTYNFERVIQGIPAPFNGFTIVIDQNGNLVSVNDNWTDSLSIPSNQNILSKSDANTIYQKALNLHLAYSQVWKNGGSTPDTELVYLQNNDAQPGWYAGQYAQGMQIQNPVIDASTGKTLDGNGNSYQPTPYQVPKVLVPGGPTTPANLPQVNWDESTALAFAQKVLGIPASYTLQNVNEYSNKGSDDTWNFSWSSDNRTQVSASVDATYGLLQSYNQFSTGPKPLVAGASAGGAFGSQSQTGSTKAKKVTQSTIEQNVDGFVKQVFANDTGGIAVVATPGGMQTPDRLVTSYQIIPIVNGIPDMSRQGNINVDSKTGEITNFWMNNSQPSSALPNPSQAVSVTAATQTWQQEAPLSLIYLMTQPSGMAGKGIATSKPKVVLAYAPMMQGYGQTLNAITGQFESSQTPAPYAGTIADLTGVSAAPQIQLLVQRELITVDNNGDVHPAQDMTNAAFVKLVVDALGQQYRFHPGMVLSSAAMNALAAVPQSSPDYNEIAAAYQMGWLQQNKQFQPGSDITRGEAAQILVKALGYSPLLDHPELIHFTAGDAGSISSGEVVGDALASGLGMLPLQSGDFNSQSPVTLADAAVAVVQAANLWGEAQNGNPVGKG